MLHAKEGYPKLVSEFEKKGHVPFQAPDCAKRGNNVVNLPPFIQIPIEKDKLDSNGLMGWKEAQVDILSALGANK